MGITVNKAKLNRFARRIKLYMKAVRLVFDELQTRTSQHELRSSREWDSINFYDFQACGDE
jgi:hypothetical protein